jgi:hypothetical protein
MASEKINQALFAPASRTRVADLKADPRNARTHPKVNLDSLVASLREFGQQKPVVINAEMQIVAGHGLVEAAKQLGWEYVATLTTDLVTPELMAAYAIADNRTAELSEWEYRTLSEELKRLQIASPNLLAALGWKDYELKALLEATYSPPPQKPLDQGEIIQTLVFKVSGDEKSIIEKALHTINEETSGEVTPGTLLAAVCEEWLQSRKPA